MTYEEKLLELQKIADRKSSQSVQFFATLESDINWDAEYDGGEFFGLKVNGAVYDALVSAEDVMSSIISLSNGTDYASEKMFSVDDILLAVKTYRSDRDAWDFVSSLTGLTKEQMKKRIRDMDAAENG